MRFLSGPTAMTSRHPVIVLLLLGISLIATGSASAQSDSTPSAEWHERIVAVAESTRLEAGLPSLQLAVGRQGEIIFDEAYGLADMAHNVLATSETRYRTASISKWFTGTATMRLYELGKLDLDAPVQSYCPQYPEKPWPITTRQLLSHTAGIRHYENYSTLLAAAQSEAERDEILAKRDRALLASYTRYTNVIAPLAGFRDDPLWFEPGTGHAYSSFGYRVLGCVIQGAADQPYRTVMGDEVFERAGMENTVDDDSRAIIPHRVTDYDLQADGTLLRAPFRDVSENLPAGGHLSTAADLTRFAQAFNAARLVSAPTIAIMASEPTTADGQTIEAGYGHGVDLIGWLPGSLGHNGNQAGTTTFLILLPEHGLSVAVMTNASGWRGSNDLAGDVLAILNEAFDLGIALPSG